jgi:hypothetical protein
MPATPARIGFVTRPYRRAVSETPSVTARHGSLARETADPLETWFSTVADAQMRADERQALFSPDRRIFTVSLSDADELLALLGAGEDEGEVPTARFIDIERGVDMMALVTEVVIDTESQQASVKVWG